MKVRESRRDPVLVVELFLVSIYSFYSFQRPCGHVRCRKQAESIEEAPNDRDERFQKWSKSHFTSGNAKSCVLSAQVKADAFGSDGVSVAGAVSSVFLRRVGGISCCINDCSQPICSYADGLQV